MYSIILGSSSPSRQALFKKFDLPHQSASPDIDETPQSSETGLALTQRLSLEKAQKLATHFSNHYIITGDQLIEVNQNILGKPTNREHAIEQLMACSAQTGTFHTSMTFYTPSTESYESHTISGEVEYQKLDSKIINHYLDKDQPWHAAGSICLEAHGFTLLKRLQSEDPFSILGMNMMWLACMLRQAGFSFYQSNSATP